MTPHQPEESEFEKLARTVNSAYETVSLLAREFTYTIQADERERCFVIDCVVVSKHDPTITSKSKGMFLAEHFLISDSPWERAKKQAAETYHRLNGMCELHIKKATKKMNRALHKQRVLAKQQRLEAGTNESK